MIFRFAANAYITNDLRLSLSHITILGNIQISSQSGCNSFGHINPTVNPHLVEEGGSNLDAS